MTNQEAIDLLDNLLGMIDDNQGNDYDEALHRAIEALSAEHKGKWIMHLADDYICRQDALDALGAEPEVWTNDDEYAKGMNVQWQYDRMAIEALSTEPTKDVVWAIEKLPSAEPEIIHCKDCKHYRFADNRAFGFPVKRCEWTGFEDVDDNDFCSRAERREE